MKYSFAERAYLAVMSGAIERTRAMPRSRDFYALIRATVTAVQDLTPQVKRLTLSSSYFHTYKRLGADEYFGMAMARPGTNLVLPEGNRLDLRRELAAMPEADRPDLRWYTVRRHRREAGEIDVDVVVHDAGPGGAFLAQVSPGTEVGFREGTGSYCPPAPGQRQLLVADETAHPALAAIAEHVHETIGSTDAITAYVELPSPEHAEPICAPFEVITCLRGEEAPGSAVLPSLTAAPLPQLDYAWACGEQSMATDVRRHLVKDRGMHRRRVMFSGYWKLGVARA